MLCDYLNMIAQRERGRMVDWPKLESKIYRTIGALQAADEDFMQGLRKSEWVKFAELFAQSDSRDETNSVPMVLSMLTSVTSMTVPSPTSAMGRYRCAVSRGGDIFMGFRVDRHCAKVEVSINHQVLSTWSNVQKGSLLVPLNSRYPIVLRALPWAHVHIVVTCESQGGAPTVDIVQALLESAECEFFFTRPIDVHMGGDLVLRIASGRFCASRNLPHINNQIHFFDDRKSVVRIQRHWRKRKRKRWNMEIFLIFAALTPWLGHDVVHSIFRNYV